MIQKDRLLKMLQDFPDEFSVDDLLDRLILLSKIDRGMRQSMSGEVLSQDEAEKRMEKWIRNKSV